MRRIAMVTSFGIYSRGVDWRDPFVFIGSYQFDTISSL